MRIAIPAACGLFLALGGCGPSVDAPPLTVRSIEARPIPLPAEVAEPASTVDPALTAALARELAAAEAGDRHFATLRTAAERAAGAAKEAGSESWTVAQQALTALVAARGPVRDASVAVDMLRQNPANAGAGARTAIDATAAQIERLDDAQAAVVAALSRRLG